MLYVYSTCMYVCISPQTKLTEIVSLFIHSNIYIIKKNFLLISQKIYNKNKSGF